MRWVVVLPAPLGPSRPTISPSFTSRSMPRTASTTPLFVLNVRASPRASIIGGSIPAVQGFALSPEVAAARAARTPIVALESTLVAHGLPWPDNLTVARELEGVVRGGGAVPATIAVVDGRP